MKNDEIDNENFAGDIPQHAVSIYGQNESVEDFPVLKAFQQYIDAEQEKARKRILMLGAFFGIVLIAVIAVFMILLHSINTRNQLLSDRLIDYAMKESQRRQTEHVPAPAPQDSEAMKAMTEALRTIQSQISAAPKAAPEKAEPDAQTRELDERLRKEKALLETEKQRLAVEKERLHQEEIEKQRRKLYPELYETRREESPRSERSSRRTRRTELSDDDIRDIIREAYPEEKATAKAPVNETKSATRDEKTQDTEEAVEYFKDDEYTIPVDINGSKSKVRFTVPVN